MHDVGARVRLAGSKPPLTINGCQHISAAEQFALLDPNAMHDQALHRTLDINYLEFDTVADDPASVGILAARFRVERRLFQHNLDEVALLRSLGEHAVHDDAANLRLGAELGVPGERRGSELAARGRSPPPERLPSWTWRRPWPDPSAPASTV